MPLYMKYGSFKGSVTSANFKEWIELSSLSVGIARNIRSSDGRGKDRSADQPMVSEVSISKTMDESSPKMMTESLKGEGQTVEIAHASMIKDQLVAIATYKLENTIISNYSISSSGHELPQESYSLNFTKISYTWKTYDDKLKATPETVFYNLAESKTG